MDIETTALPGVLLVKPKRFGDERGFFSEVFRHDAFVAAAGPVLFVQDNHSRSAQRHTLRGLHFQRPPRAQGKLVRVGRGAVLDVAVDVRHGSPHYGRHVVAELSDANGHQLWVPPGFLHGFVTCSTRSRSTTARTMMARCAGMIRTSALPGRPTCQTRFCQPRMPPRHAFATLRATLLECSAMSPEPSHGQQRNRRA
jgi:dTDP-4-dehydrorhamnose 3,5-epimerase